MHITVIVYFFKHKGLHYTESQIAFGGKDELRETAQEIVNSLPEGAEIIRTAVAPVPPEMIILSADWYVNKRGYQLPEKSN